MNCKKIIYGDVKMPSIILGIIIKEDDIFITIKTRIKTSRINKQNIVEIVDTNEEFKEE